MWFSKQKSNYVSEIDEFLQELYQKVPLSDSQRQEIAKQKRIADLRDNPKQVKEDALWDEF